jgi:hypothetical protein
MQLTLISVGSTLEGEEQLPKTRVSHGVFTAVQNVNQRDQTRSSGVHVSAAAEAATVRERMM